MKELSEKIKSLTTADVLENESLAKHTTFKIGGPADLLVIPKNVNDLKIIIEEVTKANIPYFVMGNGSNLLVSDKGIRGVVIKICGTMDKIEIHDNKLEVGAGAFLSKVLNECAEKGLSGFEFFAGIPATVGGAIAMNAGSWGGTISLFLKKVKVMTKNAKIMELDKYECGFSYRSSKILQYGSIVLEAFFELEKKDPETVKSAVKYILQLKSSSQPLTYPSAGCVFKNVDKEPAGKIIESLGLKGESIGGAKVSDVHANFIINTGNATASDVKNLIDRIKGIVFEKKGIHLEEEIKLVGFD